MNSVLQISYVMTERDGDDGRLTWRRVGQTIFDMWNWLTKLTAGGTSDLPNWSVRVYTRSGCHLCDEACSVLKRHGLAPDTIDIDSDPALLKQYTDCVPVVVIDGRVRFRGKVNEVLLRRLLRAVPKDESRKAAKAQRE
jgi:glutaredoxin